MEEGGLGQRDAGMEFFPGRRKFSTHVLAELQNLRLEIVDTSGEFFESFHFFFENLHPAGQWRRRHTRLLAGRRASGMPGDDGSIVRVSQQAPRGTISQLKVVTSEALLTRASFTDRRDSGDQVLVEHTHEPASILVAFRDARCQSFVDNTEARFEGG